jgi:hypothetical protein
MTRTLPAIAAALFAATTFLAPAAQACISCEYTPEVVNTPVYSHGARAYAKKRVYTATKKQMAPSKRQVVETRKARKIETAKADPIIKADPIEDPVALDVETENSAISTASVEKTEKVATAEEPAKEPKTVSKTGNVGCKKFFPTVGMTLTVPCE